MAKESDTVEALESFVGNIGGTDIFFRKGDLVKADNTAVKKWPHLFGGVTLRHEPAIEQATAAPGEKRGA